MSERETKSIKVNNKDVVIKTYATALEANTVQNAYFKDAEIEMVGDKPQIKKVNPNIQFVVEAEMIKTFVVSFNGVDDKAKIVELAQELPVEEYEKLVSELDQLVSKKK